MPVRDFKRKIVVLILPWLACTESSSQGRNYTMDYSQAQQFFTDVNGRPVYMKVDYFIEGTPYHPDKYYRATIFLKGGIGYTNVPVKFNLMENLVLFKTPGGGELVLTSPVEQVIFTDTADNGRMTGIVFEKGFNPVGELDGNTYYEVLDSGRVKLLKHYRVYFDDKKEYGSPSISRVFTEKAEYYICLAGGDMKKLGKGKEELIILLPDKKQAVEQFIGQHDLKCKKESDWKKVIAYYNSIHGK